MGEFEKKISVTFFLFANSETSKFLLLAMVGRQMIALGHGKFARTKLLCRKIRSVV